MVLVKNGLFIKKVKNITIGSTLSLMVFGGMSGIQSCSKGKEEQVEVYTKGVQTKVIEESKGVFKVVDETVTEPENTKAFVEYLDGRKDTLNPDQIKNLIKSEVDTTKQWDEEETKAKSEQNNAGYHPFHSGLGWLFWYSAMGHMFGRSYAYTNPRYYANPDVYNRSRQTTSVLQGSRTMRPAGSSSGFFRSSSRSTVG
jgi:hypothetical protein